MTLTSWEKYLQDGLPNGQDFALHLGLIPLPWLGDLERASVFILLLNPGLDPSDYFGEYKVPGLREALVENLRSSPDRQYPLLWLDPKHSWHSGARYFRGKLNWLVEEFVQQGAKSYLEALQFVASQVCCLQLVPYHSVSFGLTDNVVSRLKSSALARRFVREHLAARPGILTIVTRRSKDWGLEDGGRVVVYTGAEARSAHLGRNSRGGKAILDHFGLRGS